MKTSDIVRSQILNTNIDDLKKDESYISSLCVNTKYSEIELKYMFTIYNHYYQASEYGIYCSSCRAKVFRDLMKLLPLLKKQIENEKI
jgi:hypothetical protein